jgi:hypothetical protein
MPYGKRAQVELLLRDMEAQKHQLKCYKDGKEKALWIQAQVRILPFGVVEYVFPKEDLDIVLNTVCTKDKIPYNIEGAKLKLLRNALRAKPVPEFKTDLKMLWVTEGVSIIPIGIREDADIIGREISDKGWKHEAI